MRAVTRSKEDRSNSGPDGSRRLSLAGLGLLMTAVVLSPIFFGSVHTWAYTMVFGFVLAGAFLVVLSQVGVDADSGRLQVSVPLIAMTVVVPVVVLMGVLQMAPLPVWLVKMVQPQSVFHAAMGQGPNAAGASLSSVSLAPYRWPVRQSIVRWIVYGMLYWGLVQSLGTRRRIEAAVWMILGIAALESLYGMFEAFSGSHRVLWYGKSAYPGNVSGTYINRNHFAGLMEMTLPLAFCAGAAVRVGKLDAEAKIRIRHSWMRWLFPFISGRHGGEKRVLLLILGLIIGLGLIGSASRGGILGGLAGLAVVGLLFLRSDDTRRKGWGMLVVLAVLGLVSFRVDVERVMKRFENLQSSIEVRYRYTRQTLQLARDFPVAGVGLGNFRHAYPHYQSPEDKDYFIDYAHNDWAQLAAEAGWGGLAVAVACGVALVAELLWRWWRRSRSWALSLGAAGIGAAVAMAIHSWSDFNLHIPA
ncbi:MAG: O-antigen ligase family protein, partial [Thermodesulfobacteriota bacterium]